MPNPNIEILGNLSTKRQAILSFVIFSTTNVTKILSGSFVATLLNDVFGIQARGGCACAGPYGHDLLNINESQSLAVRSAIQEVKTFSTSQSNFIIFLRNKELRI
jgi:selenocysteine lyase/cysteine desulfurase